MTASAVQRREKGRGWLNPSLGKPHASAGVDTEDGDVDVREDPADDNDDDDDADDNKTRGDEEDDDDNDE